MRIAEVFGPTIQGEGPSAGRVACFVRLSGCNLDCDWCDTPYTWDWKGKNGVTYDRRIESHRMSTDDVLAALAASVPTLVVLTGGEPLLQQVALTDLAGKLVADGWDVEVETNGTVKPNDELVGLVRFNVSPKLANSGVAVHRRWKPEVIDCLARSGRAAFKFVVRNAAEVHELAVMLAGRLVAPGSVWVMPEGTTARTITDGFGAIADAAIEHRFNVGTRLHVLAWGDERGR